MTRRLFFERIATAVASMAMVPVAKASTHVDEVATFSALPNTAVSDRVQSTANRSIELQRSPIAGFQYHQGESIWADLQVGDRLRLVRESENAYDERAVRVEWQTHKLGYVPRHENAAVCHLLDRGEIVTADITALKLSNDPWERIEFTIYLTS
jgi:hypothetical protein